MIYKEPLKVGVRGELIDAVKDQRPITGAGYILYIPPEVPRIDRVNVKMPCKKGDKRVSVAVLQKKQAWSVLPFSFDPYIAVVAAEKDRIFILP